MIKMANDMDQLFRDIISECQNATGPSPFSQSVRDRLENYERNVRKEIVSRKQRICNVPLFYACELEKVETVEYLISTCEADVEQKGVWGEYDGRVSPLWCAAASGLKPIIECLVRHGAQVNAVSSIGTTPVQAACSRIDIDDNSDLVEYLVEHGADIHRANDHGRTCLMVAVRNVKTCEFLLKNGAEVDARDRRNETALHYAISRGMLDTVKLLLDYGADVTLRSLDNDDALQTACLVQDQPIVDYLVEHGSYSPGRLADANELMGSSCFINMETRLKYWRKAIEIRNSNAVDGKPLAKTPSMPKRDYYLNASEFTTLDELNAMALDSHAFMIQRILIHERIVGEHHRATFDALDILGARSDTEHSRIHQYCFDLWRRALEISVVNDLISWSHVVEVARRVVRTLCNLNERTLEVADCTRDDKEQSRFANVMAIFKLLTNLLVTAQSPSEEKRHNYDRILKCIIELIDLFVKMARTSEAKDEVRALVRDFLNQNPMTLGRRDTLLHLSVSEFFSNFEVTKFLLDSGAHVNARNEHGKTPLHAPIIRSGDLSDQTVQLLLDHGAHLDTPDKRGRTPAHMLSAKPDHLGNYMTLQCLAAQAIVKHEILCKVLPATLKQFLDLHRPPARNNLLKFIEKNQ